MKNTDETGKDLNSLPMISGNSPSYQGFSDCARPPACARARFVQFTEIGTCQHQVDGGRAGNWGRNIRPRNQLCQRDSGRRTAMAFGNLIECAQNPQAAFVQIFFALVAGHPRGIDVGGIDNVEARIDKCIKNRK